MRKIVLTDKDGVTGEHANFSWNDHMPHPRSKGREVRTAASYTVRRGVRYAATLTLNGFEAAVASNERIAAKLTSYGFKLVTVTGAGRQRVAYGTWGGADTTVEMPKQVSAVRQLES